MSTYAPAPRSKEPMSAAAPASGARQRPRDRSTLRRSTNGAAAALTAGLICACTFIATGGLNLGPMTTSRCSSRCLRERSWQLRRASATRSFYGLWPIALLLAFTALTALSVVWSVQPDDSWQDAGRMLAYSGVFAARWPLAWPPGAGPRCSAGSRSPAVVCGYALPPRCSRASSMPATPLRACERRTATGTRSA